MALKRDESGEGVPLVIAVQKLFELSVVETVAEPEPEEQVGAPASQSKVAGE